MEKSKLSLPVPTHETFDVHDPSKIQEFQDCPRGYFFRYVLGWQREESNIHLVFGSAWHEAMEVLMLEGYSMQAVDKAYSKFMDVFMQGFPDESEHLAMAPKNPEFALRALVQYVEYWGRYDKFSTLYTEVAGSVPVSADRTIHTKLDSIIRDEFGHIRSREHKTTGRNTESYRNKWSIMMQPSAYTHLLRAAFPDEEVYGVEMNVSVFTKSKGAEFIRIPVHKTDKNMRQFLWEINHWFDQIDWNFNMLEEAKESDDVMHCFPKNGMSCGKFGCKYPGMCQAWDNPLQHAHQAPPGYAVERWDPRNREKEAKTVIKPQEGGRVAIEHKGAEDVRSIS